MADQHFFLGDEWLGSRKVPNFVDLGAGVRPTSSYALFCPICAAIWGKVMHDYPGVYCQPVNSCCIKHQHFPSDGTFTSQHGGVNHPDDPRGWNDDLPLRVMQHDILALCEYYIKHPEKTFLIPRSYS